MCTKLNVRHCVALLLLVCTVSLVAQDETDEEPFVPIYALGDQTLQISLGLFQPLFFALGPTGVAPANLTPGGAGSIAWASYLSNEVTVGVEVGGSFSFTPNLRALWMVPIAARASYIISAYPFEFPIIASLGINISSLDDMFRVDPFLKAGGAFVWNYNSQWAFGANLTYWFVPQLYFDSSFAVTDSSRLGNFLEFTLTAVYHF